MMRALVVAYWLWFAGEIEWWGLWALAFWLCGGTETTIIQEVKKE